jgi:hypothetical protein
MPNACTGKLTYGILRVLHGLRLYAPGHPSLTLYCQLEQSRNGKRYSKQCLPLVQKVPEQGMTMRTTVKSLRHGRQSRRRLGPVRPDGPFASNAKQNQVDLPALYIRVMLRTPALRKYAYNDVACGIAR